jgi:glycosyltransferase involved in cell wall biosynthesis
VRRLGGTELELHALHQLQVEDNTGKSGRYESLGEDPQFDVRVAGGIGQLVPGWYLLTARCHVMDGEIIAPCFYPDYGEGMSEVTRIELPEPSGDGAFCSLVLIKRKLRSLRLDPTIHRARFELSGLHLHRISRPRALVEMLWGVSRASSHRGKAFWSAFKHFLQHAARGRISTATDELHRRYMDAHRENDRGYQHWTVLFAAKAIAGGLHERLQSLMHHPKISIVLPVHNTPLPLLRRCIDSVLAQSYPHWQLCIADDVSTSPALQQLLKQYAAKDQRIRVHTRTEHGHICHASNDALAMADGEFVGFLDHDDELAPHALLEVSKALNEHPDAGLLYSDEDKIDESGRRFDPHFKPAWNPDLLRALNYICHFTVIRRDLVAQVGGLRPGFEGAQDHDLVLRCVEQLSRRQIVHIPKVLYHWRAIAGSTALGAAQKPYALEAGRRAVEEHLVRIGRPARVEVTEADHYRVEQRVEGAPPHVAIIIPTRDKVELLRACIESIFDKTAYPDFEVVVVDNGSTDQRTIDYLAQLSGQGRATVIDYAAPFNYSAIINHAVRNVSADVVCLLNNDIEVISPSWLDELVAHALRPEVGVVGGMLYYPDDTIQHAGVVLGIGGVAGHVHGRLQRGSNGYLGRARVTHNLTALTGACMVMRREVYEEVEGMDETLPVAFNDIDFCIRIHQRGYSNVWTPHAELYHHESASRGLEDTPEKRARFALEAERMMRKWGNSLLHDPAYNPNLSLDSCQFELAFPPRNLASRHADLVQQLQYEGFSLR